MNRTKKILLVNPPRREAEGYYMPPVHLMHLKKALKALQDCSCEIADVSYEITKSLKLKGTELSKSIHSKKRQLEIDNIRKISQENFDILGIGGLHVSYYFAEQLVEEVSKTKPDAWIIIGGRLGLPLKNLWFESKIDFLVEDDADRTIIDIVKTYPDKEKIRTIRGMHYRDKDTWTGTAPELPSNLDYIDYPDWEEIDYEYFMDELRGWLTRSLPRAMHHQMKWTRPFPILMTRGCQYKCTFCFHENNMYRKHSVDYIIEYISYLKKRFDVDFLNTWDELIIGDRKWFFELCEALKKKNIGVRFFTGASKPSLVDDEILQKMKEAGFVRTSYGIESGSSTMLKEMNKMVTVEQNYNAVKKAIGHGIIPHLNMMIGMPSESDRTLKETRDFLIDLQKDTGINSKNVSFSFATAFPGSKLFDYAVDKNLITDVRKYMLQSKGFGKYVVDFCRLGEGHLKNFASSILIEMDLNEIKKRFNFSLFVRLFFVRIPKLIIRLYFPRKVISFIQILFKYWE